MILINIRCSLMLKFIHRISIEGKNMQEQVPFDILMPPEMAGKAKNMGINKAHLDFTQGIHTRGVDWGIHRHGCCVFHNWQAKEVR